MYGQSIYLQREKMQLMQTWVSCERQAPKQSREGNQSSIRNEHIARVSILGIQNQQGNVAGVRSGVVQIKRKARRCVQMTVGQSELLSKSRSDRLQLHGCEQRDSMQA